MKCFNERPCLVVQQGILDEIIHKEYVHALTNNSFALGDYCLAHTFRWFLLCKALM